MIDNSDKWIARAKELLNSTPWTDGQKVAEAVQFAASMLTAFYGSESAQLQTFRSNLDGISKNKDTSTKAYELCSLALGTIANTAAELEAGLIMKVRVLVAGEILAELLRFGKEILEEQTDSAKNVAAVITAAAFEDLMRRLALELAGISDRRPLQDIVNALKDAGTLKGGETGTAQSFLKFRNDSLHADWSNVSRVQVESCMALIEAMLMKHFS